MRSQRSAEAQGREVVGLYGDPDTTWGIGVEAELERDLAVDDVVRGMAELVERHPHLGVAGAVSRAPAGRWEESRVRTLADPFEHGGPLVRVLVDKPGEAGRSRLLVAAHHGVCDGLGLLALVGAATGAPVTPTAGGVGSRPPGGSFLATAPSRLVEALRRPPPRFPGLADPARGAASRHAEPEEIVLARTVPRAKVSTVALCQALARVFDERSRRLAKQTPGSPLLFVGASRRPSGTVAPDRQTAYLRFRVNPSWSQGEAAAAFAALDPEPDFPETSLGGLGPRLLRPLRHRLGSTAVVSNLGMLRGDVTWLAMYPALSGPRAVSVGLATTATSTTVSLRTRGREFDSQDATALLEAVVTYLLASEDTQGRGPA